MPRGPITAGQALALLLASLAVGVVVGLLLRSRWAMLLAPVAHAAAFELGRLRASGPTVDFPRLDGMFAILALMSGRGFQALVGLVPLALGAAYGAGLARWLAAGPARPHRLRTRVGLRARQVASALTAGGLVALAVLIARPASTPPILGPDGRAVPGSVAELVPVALGGRTQWASIRGYSTANPILLHLAGGPGDSDLGDGRPSFQELERDFTVAIWDQRGTGRSYPALEPTATLTLDQAVADTIALTDYLRARFGQPKIYLMGNSWGSLLGVLAVQRAPERYYAYIGSGQMVDPQETDRLIYRDLLAYAERAGDSALAARLREYGEPPYRDPLAYAFVMGYYETLAPYTPTAEYAARMRAAGTGFMGVMAPEYGPVDKVNLVRGLIDTFALLYPQLQGLDFRRDVPQLDVPVYVVAGRYELRGRAELVPQWLDQLQAPQKRLVVFEHSAHAPHAQEAGLFRDLLTGTVLPETHPGR